MPLHSAKPCYRIDKTEETVTVTHFRSNGPHLLRGDFVVATRGDSAELLGKVEALIAKVHDRSLAWEKPVEVNGG